jgi:glycosyltransferase involved in cell wall biosynthesis
MEESSPLITVLFPIYNAEPYLREAIESILNQSFRDFELLLINDGSSDGSVSIIESISDPRIRLIQNIQNIGLIATLNKGIALARGKYIARMDQDDISLPNRLEIQLALLEQHADAALVCSPVELMNADGKKTGTWDDDLANRTPAQIRSSLSKANCIAHPTVLARKSVLEKFLYSSRQVGSEDWDLWLRIVSAGWQIYKTEETLLRYRIHLTSVTALHRKVVSGERKMINVKRRFLAAQLAQLHVGSFEGKVFYSLFRSIGRDYKLNKLPVWLSFFKRLLSDSPFRAATEFGQLKQAIAKAGEPSGIFLFFPYLHMGGAEKVHAAIAEALQDQQPWVFIGGYSNSQVFAASFQKSGKLLDIPHAANHPFYAKRTRELLSSFISSQKNPRVLGCANFLFYDLVEMFPANVKCFDLKHEFRLDLDVAIEKKLLPCYLRMDKRVFISKRAIGEMIRFYELNNVSEQYLSRIRHILNYVFVPVLQPAKAESGPLTVLYAGRGTHEKRVHIVCRIAALAHQKKLPLRFVIAGDVTEAVRYAEYPFVEFLGEIRDEQAMRKIYAEAHVVLITSKREGFPMAIMEGMAQGAVPLSTPVGDVPLHMENGKNGFVTSSIQEEEVISEMIDRLIALEANRNLLQTTARHAYTYASEHFREAEFVKAYRELFELKKGGL